MESRDNPFLNYVNATSALKSAQDDLEMLIGAYLRTLPVHKPIYLGRTWFSTDPHCPDFGGHLFITTDGFTFHDPVNDHWHELSTSEVMEVCGASIVEDLLTRVPKALMKQAASKLRVATDMAVASDSLRTAVSGGGA